MNAYYVVFVLINSHAQINRSKWIEKDDYSNKSSLNFDPFTLTLDYDFIILRPTINAY